MDSGLGTEAEEVCETKVVCLRCGRLLLVDAFDPDKVCRSGRKSVCRDCRREIQREAYRRRLADNRRQYGDNDRTAARRTVEERAEIARRVEVYAAQVESGQRIGFVPRMA